MPRTPTTKRTSTIPSSSATSSTLWVLVICIHMCTLASISGGDGDIAENHLAQLILEGARPCRLVHDVDTRCSRCGYGARYSSCGSDGNARARCARIADAGLVVERWG